jgi:HlyD family secretion protein
VPTVDRAKATVMTKIRFEKLDPRILPEMSAKVVFLSQAATDADPEAGAGGQPQAVVERDGRKQVLRVKRRHRSKPWPVTPGRTLGDALEITGALKSGDKLVLSPMRTSWPAGPWKSRQVNAAKCRRRCRR